MRRLRKSGTRTFHSKFEEDFSKDLDQRGIAWEYESKTLLYSIYVVSGECSECGSKQIYSKHRYFPDFYLPKQDLYIETKGKFSVKDRIKILNVVESNPTIDLRMVFMRDNWVTKAHKMRYSDWCDHYNIKWSLYTLPEEWINNNNDETR